MECKASDSFIAARQLPKFKSLLKKYRHLKNMQSNLLTLSELAATVTDMGAFYTALASVVEPIFRTKNFHIAIVNKQGLLELAYMQNNVDAEMIVNTTPDQWQNGLTAEVYREARTQHFCPKQSIESDCGCLEWLGAPLKRENKVIGVIAIQSYQEDLKFDKADADLLTFISEHIVTAIDRVRSRQSLENSIAERTRKLTQANAQLQKEIVERQKAENIHKVLLSISEITASSDDIQQFYQALHHQVKKLLPAKNFFISLLSNDGYKLEYPYIVNEQIIEINSSRRKSGLTERTIVLSAPLLLANQELVSLTPKGGITPQDLSFAQFNSTLPKAWLSAPLMHQDRVIGVLALQDFYDENAYQQDDLEIIRFIADHIASAINRKNHELQEQKNKDELERLVNERTKELQISNLNLRMQVEERRKAEAKLYHEAHHDSLTTLPNRAMFSDRLSFALRHIKRHPQNRFAVLFIDLDRFKMINDTLGHHAGDEFLIEIANRLKVCVRDNDLLARLGGDEFVVLLDSMQSQEDVEDVCARIIDKIAEPFVYDGNELYSNASIGIALCSHQYNDANEILRDADAAMYQAKSLGRGRFVFFDESMREKLLENMSLEQELRAAIKQQQFELHYQQISNLDSTSAIGFEALLRWNHPTKGLLTPSQFLFMAEETGIILEIETWVIEEVCQQLSQWQDHKKYSNAFIGVNLSGRQLTQANQLNKLISLIKSNTVEPERLILEFNESAFTQHTELAHKGLRKLKEFGVKLALDDYGAGVSSFSFLHSYPFEFIKLDRSFIRTLNNSDKNLTLVKALNELGEQFGYRIVAEGIESETMLKKLQGVGCEFGQGYHISRPTKIDSSVAELITNEKLKA